MKRGFVISFDALIAMSLLLLMVITASYYLGNVKFEANNSLSLKEIAMDSIIVLEKNGALERAINDNNVTGLSTFLDMLPNNICADIRIYEEENLTNYIMLVLRSGCERNFEDLATLSRGIVVGDSGNADFYLAELRAWYRVSE